MRAFPDWPKHVERRANDFLSLLKYSMWTAALQEPAFELVQRKQRGEDLSQNDLYRGSAFLSYWLASLCVLTEGWEKLGLTDATVDRLLAESACSKALTLFRHSVFHFHRNFDDDRIHRMAKDPVLISWAVRLSHAYMTFFAPHGVAIDTPLIEEWLFAPVSSR